MMALTMSAADSGTVRDIIRISVWHLTFLLTRELLPLLEKTQKEHISM
jgi:hypothetical protein